MTEESVDIYYELYPCVPGRSVSLTASPALDTWKAELWTLTLCRASIYCYCLPSIAHLQLHYCIKIPCQCYVRLSSSGWIKIRYLDICVFSIKISHQCNAMISKTKIVKIEKKTKNTYLGYSVPCPRPVFVSIV